MLTQYRTRFSFVACLLMLLSCRQRSTEGTRSIPPELDLKTGAAITCGPAKELGALSFKISCGEAAQAGFDLGLKLLHSFEYDEAEKEFANILTRQPDCAMAYWGVAMANFHALWTPPSQAELRKGAKALQIARELPVQSARETAYITAISAFYGEWERVDHRTRCLRFEKAMDNLRRRYPDDPEATIFYALALNAAADPKDKSFAKQKQAGVLLQKLYQQQPNHPGVVHYLIHTYDSPELAALALPAARKYASIAPSSAHALHMPSHIFTRLGLWEECIQANRASVASAQCYAEAAGIKGHWDEELHGLDYLVYAYLQKGDQAQAQQQLAYLKTIRTVNPVSFKAAYAFAAIPARYVLENKRWKEAAQLPDQSAGFPWETFPWQQSMTHFARLMGWVHLHKLDSAQTELKVLHQLQAQLTKEKDAYKANQVLIQIRSGEAWIQFGQGRFPEAQRLMTQAAEMEDQTEKHPVTPGEIIPARELLADMLLEMNQPAQALAMYEADLKKHPNRLNALYGAGLAAEKAGDLQKAGAYYRQIPDSAAAFRPELAATRHFLRRHAYSQRK